MRRVDYISPHGLLVEALGPLGARARLLRRLGPEAAEPIDEFLGASLAYAASHPPSLQGFVHWLRQSGAEVTRQAEEAGRTLRVMTVHGAKGLQAPLVILPDTTALPPDGGWAGGAEGRRPALVADRQAALRVVDDLRTEAKQARMEEYNRLLYVALTRAEDRLVVCGWDTRHSVPDESLVPIRAPRPAAPGGWRSAAGGRWRGVARRSAGARITPDGGRGTSQAGSAHRSGGAPPLGRRPHRTGCRTPRPPNRPGPCRWRRAVPPKPGLAPFRPQPLPCRGGGGLQRGALIPSPVAARPRRCRWPSVTPPSPPIWRLPTLTRRSPPRLRRS